MTMSSLSQDIAFRVRLALDTSSEYDVPLSCYKLKRLEDVLTLQSAHDTGSIDSVGNAEDLIEQLPRNISDFVTYFIRKLYIGSNISRTSNSLSRRRDREMDLNNFKLLIDMYAPDLEEANLVYHVAGDSSSFAEIRHGFRNAEAASNSAVQIVLEPAYAPITTPMDTNNGGNEEVIEFVLSITYGIRERKIDSDECSQEGNEVGDSDEEESEEVESEEEESEGSQEGNEVGDSEEEESEEGESEGDPQDEENHQIGNDTCDGLESSDNPEEAGSAERYPSKWYVLISVHSTFHQNYF